MPSHTPDPVKSMAGKIGAHVKWSALDTAGHSAATSNARAALEAKWLTEADGDPVRAANIKAAFYARMAMRSAMARRKPRLLRVQLAEAEAELAEVEAAEADLDHGDDAA